MVSISSKLEVFGFSGGRNPLLWGLHLTCNAHFRTRRRYSSQKSYVKIWFRLVEIEGMLIFVWGGGAKVPIRRVTCGLRCPFSNLSELFQSKVMRENLIRIGWAFQELSCPQTYKKKEPPIVGWGGCIWPVRPRFELSWAMPVKRHVWKFALDWLKSEVC